MNTKYAAGLVLGAMVIAGGAYYLFTASPNGLPAENGDSTQDTVQPGGTEGSVTAQTTQTAQTSKTGTKQTTTLPTIGTFSGPITQLIQGGGQRRCSVDTSSSQSKISGVIYVANGRLYGSFTTTISGFGEVRSYMLSDATTLYTWAANSQSGLMMPLSQVGMPTTAQSTTGGTIDVNKPYSYFCEQWSVDMSLFTFPKNVTFSAA